MYGTKVSLIAISMPTTGGPIATESYCQEKLIEYAGRLCYNLQEKVGTKPGWIQERIKDGHESILEHASATFLIVASRVLTHELVRHRIASYSQRSQRYVKENKPRYITPPEFQVGPLTVDTSPGFNQRFLWHMQACWSLYSDMLKAGYKPEIARYVLPGACETQIVMTMNFRELRHFIKLRTSKRALPEMREVTGKVLNICKTIAPEVFGDLEVYEDA